MTVFPRPPYAPNNFTWWPGEDPRSATEITIREANSADADALAALIRSTGRSAGRKRMFRWFTQNTYSVRLVCRNYRHPIAAIVTKTTYAGTRVELLAVAPPYAGRELDRRLLEIATAELPEQPTTIRLPSDDVAAAERLRSLGWKFTGNDRDNAEFTFSKQLIDVRPPATVQKDGESSAPPAGY